MTDRFRQLLIIGGIFQPFLLGLEYIDVILDIFDVKTINMNTFSWSLYLLYWAFLLSACVLFLFPMSQTNKYIYEKCPKTFIFLACIGWVPYISIPVNFMMAHFKEGVPEEYYDFIISYLSFYEFSIGASFILALILLIRKIDDEHKTKTAKKRYKNNY